MDAGRVGFAGWAWGLGGAWLGEMRWGWAEGWRGNAPGAPLALPYGNLATQLTVRNAGQCWSSCAMRSHPPPLRPHPTYPTSALPSLTPPPTPH